MRLAGGVKGRRRSLDSMGVKIEDEMDWSGGMGCLGSGGLVNWSVGCWAMVREGFSQHPLPVVMFCLVVEPVKGLA